MGGVKICTIGVAVLAVMLYRLTLLYPSDIQCMPFGEKVMRGIFSNVFKLLYTAEGLGYVGDTSIMARNFFDAVNSKFGIDYAEHPDVRVEKTTVDSVPVLIVWPSRETIGGKNSAALVYFHGGGFVLGNAALLFLWSKKLALEADVVVISVDYRLAPEHPFPAGLEDCLKVTKAVFDDADKFQIDPSRILVAGESSGGNLAAVVATKLALSDEYHLRGQILISPVLQALDVSTLPSYKAYAALIPLPSPWMFVKYAGVHYSNEIHSAIIAGQHLTDSDRKRFARFLNISNMSDDVKSLLPREQLEDNLQPLAAAEEPSPQIRKALNQYRDLCVNEIAWPLLTADDDQLRQMCPALISITGYDPLRDEALLYYDRLRALGAKVSLSFIPRVGHVSPLFATMSNSTMPENVKAKFFPDILSFIKEQTLIH